MFALSVENKYGDKLRLTGNDSYNVVSVTGLTPAAANINMDALAITDGSVFNSSQVGGRNIVITVAYKGRPEDARLELYKYFKTKQPIRVYYATSSRDVYIDGYVETFDGDLFEQGQKAQISIICPNPFFRSVATNHIDFLATAGLLEFPVEFPEEGIEFSGSSPYSEKNIYNSGEVESGMQISVAINGNVSNPIFYNLTSNERLGLNYDFENGDRIEISTLSGAKSVTLIRSGVEINLLNYIMPDTTWIALYPGDNIFTYTATAGRTYMDVVFTIQALFEGV